MKNMLTFTCCIAVLATAGAKTVGTTAAAAIRDSATKSCNNAVDYLLSRQGDDGAWASHPAITALAVMGIHQADGEPNDKIGQAVTAGLDYILRFVQPDGSIWTNTAKEYPNYTTAISLLVLNTVNRPPDLDVIKSARRYLMNSQFMDKNRIDHGGIGYGKTGRADMSNGSWAAEALYYTDHLDREPHSADPQAAKSIRKVWERMAVFLSNCQNLPETNKQNWVCTLPNERGGAVYRPHESKAGEVTEADGRVSLLSSGSMTYAMIKSMIYARLDRDDVRVKGAIDYARRHYTFEENPGMGLQGYYYYLYMMAKALDVHGGDVIVDSNGTKHNWRDDILNAFISRQRPDGSWINSDGRYMESVPELVTSYNLIAMKVAMK